MAQTLGRFWLKQSGHVIYMTGHVEILGQKIALALVPNNEATKPGHPTHNCIARRPLEVHNARDGKDGNGVSQHKDIQTG